MPSTKTGQHRGGKNAGIPDVVILGRSEGYTRIKGTLEEMAAMIHQIGLQKNDTKTKYVINRQDGKKVKAIELMGKKCEKVESFKYLGSVMTSVNGIETEVKSKIAFGNKCYYALGPILTHCGPVTQICVFTL